MMKTKISVQDNDLLLIEQVKELYRNLPTVVLAGLVIGLFQVFVLWSITADIFLGIWYGYHLLVSLIRIYYALQYKRDPDTHSIRFWLGLYMYGVLASGLGWGATIIFLVPIESTFYVISSVFLLCGLVTGAAASFSSLKYAFSVFSIPALLPTMIYLAVKDQSYSLLISTCIFVFFIFITSIALRIHKTILYSIKKQIENARILVEVEREKDLLEEKCLHLEKELELSNEQLKELKENLKGEIYSHISTLDIQENRLKDNKFSLLLERFNGGVWDWNIRTGTVEFSDSWIKMLGYNENDIGRNFGYWESLLHPDERLEVINKLHLYTDGKNSSYSSAHRLRSKSGDWVWVISRGVIVAWGTYGEALEMIGIEINIADCNEELAHMLYMSNVDANRWISNVNDFKDRLDRILQTCRDNNFKHMFCYLIIDKSSLPKKRNEFHEQQLVSQISRVVLDECRQRDTLVNFENYSLGLLLENCSLETGWKKAKKIRNLLAEYQFSYEDNYYNIDISIGITPVAGSSGNVDQVINDAKIACDIARDTPPDYVYMFQNEDKELASRFIEEQTLAHINEALTKKRFQITKVSLKAISSFFDKPIEDIFLLKLRLIDERGHYLPREHVNSIAIKNNITTNIDQFFIEMFAVWARKQSKKYIDSQNVYFLNLFYASLANRHLIGIIKKVFEENNSLVGHVCFIIHDENAISNIENIEEYIREIKSFGCKFAMKNINVNSLSMEYIKKLSIDYVIIDNKLINTLETDAVSISTVKYINEISHLMNIKTIVENNNDEHKLEILKDIGVDYVRGKNIEQLKTAMLIN